MKKYQIKEEQEKIRIDKLVSQLEKDLSRTTVQRMIEEGNILVNDKIINTSYKVVCGDIITINEEKPKEIDILPQEMPLDIVYEDDDIIIINKEKGIVVHPGARKSR